MNPHKLSHSHSHSLARTHTHTHTLSLTHSHSFLLILTQSITHSLPPSLTHSLIHYHSHYHTHANIHSLTPAEAGFKSLQGLVRTIRNARNEYNVEPGRKIAALVRLTSTSPSAAVFAELLDTEGTHSLSTALLKHLKAACV